jgi:hypothetical protein
MVLTASWRHRLNMTSRISSRQFPTGVTRHFCSPLPLIGCTVLKADRKLRYRIEVTLPHDSTTSTLYT